MWGISYSRQAVRALARMPSNTAKRIRDKIEELAKDPTAMRNVVRLTGVEGYRLRVGDWRVIYVLEQDEMVVVVVKIKPRGEVYR
ncbi:MAG TPA: type II toxin-antitoxin system RelE/ParE family toxin [Acidiferrobacteraceae bacterium]|nr:type II toxin-antitoxin system RelE/ParE family toxin [Acidiferrobacteraceae bacterium]